jgi:hypothetical protein
LGLSASFVTERFRVRNFRQLVLSCIFFHVASRFRIHSFCILFSLRIVLTEIVLESRFNERCCLCPLEYILS